MLLIVLAILTVAMFGLGFTMKVAWFLAVVFAVAWVIGMATSEFGRR